MRKQQTASHAHQYGITKENNSFLGLNPNLDIEDQYVENLLKQIHFMNLQVKLLKEKQSQSQGNGLWGVVNRSSQPLVKNIVDSNQKYQSMKKEIDSQINKTELQNIKMAQEQAGLLSKMHHFQASIQNLHKQSELNNNNSLQKQGKNQQKIGQLEQKLAKILAEKQQEKKKNQELNCQHQAMSKQIEREQFNNKNELTRIKQDEDIQKVIQQDCVNSIAAVKQHSKHIRDVIQNDMDFQRAKDEQRRIRQKLGQVGKDTAETEFRLLGLAQSIKLGVQEREKEVLQRKKLMEQYESLKQVLFEIEELNGKRREKEVNNRNNQSQDILKGTVQSKKLQKNLQELKKKLARQEESQKKLRKEVGGLDGQLSQLKQTRQVLTAALTKIVTANDQQDTALSNHLSEQRRLQDQLQKVLSQELGLSTDLNLIEGQVVGLRQRKEYLSDALSLKDTLNQTKLQELQKVVQKNKDMNETVAVLMDKWEDIKRFSKA